MSMPKKQLGRPRKSDAERMVLRSIRMTPAQWSKIDAAGADQLRAMVDKWKPKLAREKQDLRQIQLCFLASDAKQQNDTC